MILFKLFEMFGLKPASRTTQCTIKELKDLKINYDIIQAVRDVRPQAGISNDEYQFAIRIFKTPISEIETVSTNRIVGANCIRQHHTNVHYSGMAQSAAGG